jgi:hypothetical protein
MISAGGLGVAGKMISGGIAVSEANTESVSSATGSVVSLGGLGASFNI